MRDRAVRRALAGLLLLQALAAAAQVAPGAVYQRYHSLALTNQLDEMLKLAAPEQRAALGKMGAADRLAWLRRLQEAMPRSYMITGTAIAPSGRTARVSAIGHADLGGGKSEARYGTIAMTSESGRWKVADAAWTKVRPAGVPEPPLDDDDRKPPAIPPAPAAAAARSAPGPAAPPAAARIERSQEAKRRAAPRDGGCEYKPVMTEADLARCRK